MKIVWYLIVFFDALEILITFRAKITRPIFEKVVLLEFLLNPLCACIIFFTLPPCIQPSKTSMWIMFEQGIFRKNKKIQKYGSNFIHIDIFFSKNALLNLKNGL